MTTATEDRGLVAAAQAGDERAFRALVAPFERALEVHCYRMLGSLHDAEDLVQETLLRAWRGLEHFERRASVRTWLYRIATNACLDELERRPRRPEDLEPYPDARLRDADVPVYDPAARYAQREGMELALLAAIQQLPGRQRAVLILRDVLGMTGQEVADLLDTTVAGTNSALQRARATIDPELPPAPPAQSGAAARELLRRYVDAWERVDVDGLVALTREDAAMRMPPQRTVVGAEAIGAFFLSICGKGTSIDTIRVEPTSANGAPALAMRSVAPDGSVHPHGILVLDVRGDRVAGLDAFIDGALLPAFATG